MDGAKVYPLPARDPVSGGPLIITEVESPDTGVTIRGRFEMPRFAQLSPDQARYLETFLRCRGMLNSVERELGISYPTARARLDAVLKALDLHAVREDPLPQSGVAEPTFASDDTETGNGLVPEPDPEPISEWEPVESGNRVFEQAAFDEPLEEPEPVPEPSFEEPEPPAEPAFEEAPPAPKRTRNEILTLLERGEITPEEAKRELSQ